jgi:hypothetical protein
MPEKISQIPMDDESRLQRLKKLGYAGGISLEDAIKETVEFFECTHEEKNDYVRKVYFCGLELYKDIKGLVCRECALSELSPSMFFKLLNRYSMKNDEKTPVLYWNWRAFIPIIDDLLKEDN